MIKKMAISTLIFSLITINLILWPYLYKQSNGSDTESSKVSVIKDTKTAEDTEPGEAEIDSELLPPLNDTSSNLEVNKNELESEDIFKVVDIK